MKTFTKIWMGLLILFLTNYINAQPPQHTPEEMAKRETERVKERIALSDSQALQYEHIALKYAKMRRNFRDIPRDSMETFRKKMSEHMEMKKAEVKQILSADQFAKYEKWLEENRNRMGRGHREGNNPPPPQQ